MDKIIKIIFLHFYPCIFQNLLRWIILFFFVYDFTISSLLTILFVSCEKEILLSDKKDLLLSLRSLFYRGQCCSYWCSGGISHVIIPLVTIYCSLLIILTHPQLCSSHFILSYFLILFLFFLQVCSFLESKICPISKTVWLISLLLSFSSNYTLRLFDKYGTHIPIRESLQGGTNNSIIKTEKYWICQMAKTYCILC